MGRSPIIWQPDSPTATGRGVRRRTRAGVPPPKKGWTLPPKVRQYLPYAVVFLVILAPLLHNPPRDNRVPPYLVGVWRSATPGYEDRYFQFAQRTLIFGTGGIEGEAYMVAEVQSAPADEIAQSKAGKRQLFTIRYMKMDRQEYELSFYYDPEPEEVITFKHQEKLKWTKTRKGSES